MWQYVFFQVGQTLTSTIALIVRIHNSSNIFHNFHNQFGWQEGFACWTTCLSRLGWSTYAQSHTPIPISLWHESSYCLATFSVPIFLLFGNSGPCRWKNYQPFSKVPKSILRKWYWKLFTELLIILDSFYFRILSFAGKVVIVNDCENVKIFLRSPHLKFCGKMNIPVRLRGWAVDPYLAFCVH